MIEKLSAITLATRDMASAVRFYTELGFKIRFGGETASFTSLGVGQCFLNLALRADYVASAPWGRIIFYVKDVDRFYQSALASGLTPSTVPRDAEWGERYFHINDADGNELSFARPLKSDAVPAPSA